MIPHYNPNRQKPTKWKRFMWRMKDLVLYVVIVTIISAVILFFLWLIPRCPKCDNFIHPMDVYCGKCGHQLRTTD